MTEFSEMLNITGGANGSSTARRAANPCLAPAAAFGTAPASENPSAGVTVELVPLAAASSPRQLIQGPAMQPP